MTPMARLLTQGQGLRRDATQSTGDVNEAYLLVHHVMTRSFRHISEGDVDLAPALARALHRRSQRRTNAGAVA